MGRRVSLPYLVRDVDRHGNVRVYVRKNGKKTRIRSPEGSTDFLTEYSAALDGPQRPQNAAPESLRWLVEQYYTSSTFRAFSPATRRIRRRILDDICTNDGDKRFAVMQPRHVARIRDASVLPEAANSRLKALRALFKWATLPEVGLAETNPTRDVSRIRNNSGGHHTWTIAEIHQFCANHPLGTKPRLAMDILLFTGARRSDAVTFGRQMVQDGWLTWIEAKGKERFRKQNTIPVLPALQESLTACPSGHLNWLVTSYGKPFTPAGFGNWFREQCNAAGLPHCSAHGLRKAGATIAADNGATTHQLMAIWGWLNIQEAERYTRKANRKRLAGEAMNLIRVPLSKTPVPPVEKC